MNVYFPHENNPVVPENKNKLALHVSHLIASEFLFDYLNLSLQGLQEHPSFIIARRTVS